MKQIFWVALLLCGCDSVSGVDVSARWTAMSVSSLEVTTTLGDGTPVSQILGDGQSIMTSPYRVLVKSPAGENVQVAITARTADQAVATGSLEVKPGTGQILQVTLDLLPTESP